MKQIIITEDTITRVALDLASKMDRDEPYTEEQFSEATVAWLRSVIKRITDHPDDFAFGGFHFLPEFNIPAQCDARRCTRPPLPDDIFCQEHREEEDSYVEYVELCRSTVCIYEDCGQKPEAGSNLCPRHAAREEFLDDPRNWRAAEEERQLANLDKPLTIGATLPATFAPTPLEQTMRARHEAGTCGWGCPECQADE